MATYYWVGGNGTWDNVNTANWSASTGGAGGAGVPGGADTVIFDSASGTGTCTTASGSACSIATLNTSTLNLTLGANHTMSGTFTLTLGTLNLASYKLTVAFFASTNTNSRTIAFGTGSIDVTGSGTTVWSTLTSTNLVVTGTPTVNFTYSGSTGTRTISTGSGLTESNVYNINIIAGSDIIGPISAVKSLNFTGFSGSWNQSTSQVVIYQDLTISSGMTVTGGTGILYFYSASVLQKITTNGKNINSPITIGSGTSTNTLQLQDNLTMGSTRTFTLTSGTLDLTGNSGNWTLSAGIFASTGSTTRAISFGTGKITVTNSGTTVLSMGTLTGFSYTGTSNVELTYSGSTGTRSLNVGSTDGTELNSINVKVSAGADALTITNGSKFKNFDLTGFTGSLNNNSRTIYGNCTFGTGMTVVAGSSAITFAGTSGSQQITSNSVSLDVPLTFNGIGGTFAFQDALTQGSTRAFTITNGTVKLKNGATSTVGVFATSGTNQKYLQSTVAGSQATLSQASGTVGVSYLTIQDIYATGGATWNAFYANNNVDAGNNTNWNFGGTPSYDAEYGYKLRSFTERGRF